MPRPVSPRATVRKPKKRTPRARLEVDARRSQFLTLGLAIFSERSYDEVSMDDLAKAAAVSKGLLYHYFPTKRDFYVAALGEAAEQLLSETETDRTLPPDERARRGIESYLDFVERHGPAYVALMRGGIGSDPEVAAVLEQTRSTFAERILQDVPREAVRPLLRIALRGWIGFVEATSIEWVAHRGVSREELVGLIHFALFDVLTRAALAPPFNADPRTV